jgi:glucose-6-phosphate 1-dehydrogenase
VIITIPPSLFGTVIQGLGTAELADQARVIVEKPFGRDLASARELNRAANVQITMSENFGVEKRGAFYETAGCLRDVIQNHMFQVVALLAMEPAA